MGRFGLTPGEEVDLLAASEDAEFEASVKAARARTEARRLKGGAATVRSPVPEEEAEIEWAEQEDVYRPRRIDANAYLASLTLNKQIQPQSGQSIAIIRKPAYQAVCDHLRSNTEIELGGLLCGEALYDPGRDLFIVDVDLALPACNGDGTATTFSYTPASWQAMSPALQQMSADRTIVGSYHSHPGMGVFLSPTDLDTQAEVFPHDWQVAMVMDPVANTCGLFMGASGRVCRFLVV